MMLHRDPMRLLAMLLILLGFQGAAAESGGSALEWLVRMNQEAALRSFEGTFIYVDGGRVETMQIARKVDGATVRERLVALDGEAREVIRDNNSVWCFLPSQGIGIQEPRVAAGAGNFPAIVGRDAAALKRLYRVSFSDKSASRIANRITRVISVRPRDSRRYGYQIWVDRDTGLVLRAKLLAPDDRILEEYMFTQIDYGEGISEDALLPRTPPESLKWFRTESGRPAAGADWKIAELPRGFREIYRTRRISPLSREYVDHIVVSDGLATVSVFVGRADDRASAILAGAAEMGALQAYGLVVDGWQVIALGEVPGDTATQIGEAVKLR